MSAYRIKIGIDHPLANLNLFTPQPRSTGVQATRRSFTGAGIVEEGLYVELIWDVVDSVSEYQALLNTAGILNTDLLPVTVYARDQIFNWHLYNGYAVRPEPVWSNYFARLTILVRDLREQS